MAEPSPAARSAQPFWIAIGLLAAALVLTLVLLFMKDAAPSDYRAAPDPSASAGGRVSPAPASPAAAAPVPAPAPDDPEAAARLRLLRISQALDLYFRGRYEFPDRLEVLIAKDLLKPAELDDPWRRPVDYARVAKERFKLCSRGPDATSYTDDDVCIGPGGRPERPGR